MSWTRQDYFSDNNAAFRSPKQPESPVYVEQGIPVKHINNTGTDIAMEARRAKVSIVGASPEKTNLPFGSTRITLPSAEKSALGSNMKIHLAYANPSNGRGRVPYVRSVDDQRSFDSVKSRSRSADDLNKKQDQRFMVNGQRSQIRRAMSSDQSLASGGGSKGRPGKPRIAFGSFILPKESTPRLNNTQLKFHEIKSTPPMGSYVHTHTRRSPYAAPATVLFQEDHKAFAGSSSIRRPYTATHHQQQQQLQLQHKEQQQQHPNQVVTGKQLAQRHSAPSSYSHARDRAWRASRQTLSIDQSPSRAGRGPAPSMHNHVAQDILPNKMRVQLNSTVIQQPPMHNAHSIRRQDNVSSMNAVGSKARGVAQHRFVSKMTNGHQE